MVTSAARAAQWSEAAREKAREVYFSSYFLRPKPVASLLMTSGAHSQRRAGANVLSDKPRAEAREM